MIGVLATPETSPAAPAVLDMSAIEAGLAAQVAQFANVPTIQEGPLAPGELPLDTLLTFKQQLRWAYLETTALGHIDKQLTMIAQARSRAASDGHIASWQRGTILGNLANAAAELSQLRATIATDQLVYQTRADLSKVWKLHIPSQVVTADREMLSAYDLSGLAAIYANEMAPMPQEIVACQSQGHDVTNAQNYVSNLSAEIRNMSYDGSAILGDVQSGSYKGAHGFQQAGLSAQGAAQFDLAGAKAAIASLKALGC